MACDKHFSSGPTKQNSPGRVSVRGSFYVLLFAWLGILSSNQSVSARFLLTATISDKRRFDLFIEQKPILLRPPEHVAMYFAFPVVSKLIQIKLRGVNALCAVRL